MRVKPGSYDIGPETIGAGQRSVDPRFPNKELEWATKRRGVTFLVGLLVKVEGMGDDLDRCTRISTVTPTLPQPSKCMMGSSNLLLDIM